MQRHAGIRVHLRKTQCWPRGGAEAPAPEGIPALNVEGEKPVWKGDLPPARNGLMVLKILLGSQAYVNARDNKRI